MDENDEPIQASNNKFYKISVDNNFKKEIISIKCESKEYENIIPPKKYSTIDYTIDDLKKLNKFFIGFDTIKDVYNELENHKKNRNIQLLEEDTNNLILKIPLNSLNYKELKFELKRVGLDHTKAIDDLYEIIQKLNNKNNDSINSLIFEIENLKNQKKVMEDDYKKENEKINNLINNLKDEKNNEINGLKKEIKNLNNLLKIIKNEKNNEINKLRKEKKAFEEKTKKDFDKFNLMIDSCFKGNEEIHQTTKNILEKNIELDKLVNNLKVNMKKIFFSFSFKELEIKKIKNEKNLEYFKDIMNRYYNTLIILDDHFLLKEKYKSSYDYLIELIFEEITEKNSNNCDKLLEFLGGNNYDKWTRENWNAFFTRNSIHQMFYCENIEVNEKLLDNIYEKLAKLIPNLKRNKDRLFSSYKYDTKGYYEYYQIYYIIEVLKKKISEIKKKSEEWCVKLNIY